MGINGIEVVESGLCDWKFMDLNAWITTGNGIIFGVAMAEKKSESGEMRYSAAYPTGAERFMKRSEWSRVGFLLWDLTP